MEFALTKGMAMAIRAIFNIDPVMVQNQLNDTVKKAEKAFTDLNYYLEHFDKRLVALESATTALTAKIDALKPKDELNGKFGPSENRHGNGHDTTATG